MLYNVAIRNSEDIDFELPFIEVTRYAYKSIYIAFYQPNYVIKATGFLPVQLHIQTGR